MAQETKEGRRGDIFFAGVNVSPYLASKWLREGHIERTQHSSADGQRQSTLRNVFLRKGLSQERRTSLLREYAARILAEIHASNNEIMLAGPSALHGGLVSNIIYLASTGSSRQARVIENTFVAHYTWLPAASPGFEAETLFVEDGLGKVAFRKLPDEALLLMSFQASRSVTSSKFKIPKLGLSVDEQIFLFERLCQKHGSSRQAWTAIRQCANALKLPSIIVDRAKQFSAACLRANMPVVPRARFDVRVDRWRLGQLHCHGARLGSNEWIFRPEMVLPALSFMRDPRAVVNSRLPVFFECLLPERMAMVDDADRSRMYQLFGHHQRYMSQVSIVDSHAPTQPAIVDLHETRIAEHCDGMRVFQGVLGLPESNGNLMRTLNQESERSEHPSMAGVQDKIACSLSADGTLASATGRPFTHLLKLGFAQAMQPVPSGEWFCAHLLRAAGVDVAEFALVDFGESDYPGFLSERFDIGHAADPREIIIFEDFCSLLDQPVHLKYKGSMESVAEKLIESSDCLDEDAEQLFRQVVGSFLVGNMDGHLRNFGMVSRMPQERVSPGAVTAGHPSWCRTRLAPAFDVVCTNGLPWISMVPALSIGKQRHYSKDVLLGLAQVLSLDAGRAKSIMQEMADQMHLRAVELIEELPRCIASRERAASHVEFIRLNIIEASRQLDLDAPTRRTPLVQRRMP